MIEEALRLEILDWIAKDPDTKTASVLRRWLDESNEIELRKSFSGFLQFGTAGLRGEVRPGPSGMNRAVVARTAAGIAEFLKSRNLKRIVIGRDARNGSKEFMAESAEILSGAGLDVYLLPRELPTPVLAFAVNELKMDCGIMITASHNPALDNGYKVYLGGVVDCTVYRGSQIVSPADLQIAAKIAEVSWPLPRGDNWQIVGEGLIDSYVSKISADKSESAKARIIYTAMHGVGTKTLLSVFECAKFQRPILVTEQAEPDPKFPTVKFPNPEESGAIDLAISLATSEGADLVIANDPDADRCAVAAKGLDGNWSMLTGDQLGTIFGYYLASKKSVRGGVLATTIVSSSALEKIAAKFGLKYQETLTGFKYLSKVEDLIFGYEEAIGYCVDPRSVNDKDGISAALLAAQINSELLSDGLSLFDYLARIWQEIGLHLTSQISIRVNELEVRNRILRDLRQMPPEEIAGIKVVSFEDLALSPTPTDGLRIWLAGDIRIIIRPSGTEPKLKCYIEITGAAEESKSLMDQVKGELNKLFTRYS